MEHQETINEAATEWTKSEGIELIIAKEHFLRAIKFGAQWQQAQQEGKWTDADMYNALHFGYGEGRSEGLLHDMPDEFKDNDVSPEEWLTNYKQYKNNLKSE